MRFLVVEFYLKLCLNGLSERGRGGGVAAFRKELKVMKI